MNKRRLLKMADFLEKLPPRKFDFNIIVSGDNCPGKCGSVGCAVGWAPVIFPKLLEYTDFIGVFGVKVRLKTGEFRTADGWPATEFDHVGKVLDLDCDEMSWLFEPSEYISQYGGEACKIYPKMVAKRIRQFVKDGGLITQDV